MAPELALEALHRTRYGAIVLDPMCGSGTVLKLGVEEGWQAVGFDMDPLAVLLSRVACTRVNANVALRAAERLANQVTDRTRVKLPWIDDDPATLDYVEFWFSEPQRSQLRQIAALLLNKRGPTSDLLRVALSRTIIAKDRGASLARDVSHSRPHRVRVENDYDVIKGFLSAAKDISNLVDRPIAGNVTVKRGDARRLPVSLDGTVDLVITSPPYLNAIDYMRGHKLSLVWLGYQIPELSDVRSKSVGAERAPDYDSDVAKVLVPRHRKISSRQQAMIDRYALDMHVFTAQIARTLTEKGEAVVVVGDSIVQGAFVKNSLIVEKAAKMAGLKVVERRSRRLPASSRYLPPPAGDDGPLSKRMRSEVVLHFKRDLARI